MPPTHANAQDLVEIKTIRDNTVVLKNGGLRQVIMVNGINFALKSEDEQNIIIDSYRNYLNGIDFPLQILVRSRKINIEKYLETLGKYKNEETSPLLQNQNDEYREFIRGFVEKNAIMEKTFLVIVQYAPLNLPSTSSITNAIPFLRKDTTEKTIATQEDLRFSEHAAQLKQRVNQIIQGLFTIGLDATILTDEELIELFYNFYNPESVERENISTSKQ